MPKPITPNKNNVDSDAIITIPANGDPVEINQFWDPAIQQLVDNASAATALSAMSFTTPGSSTISIPAWARLMYYYLVGGGGGGGGGIAAATPAGGGGSSGCVASGILPVRGYSELIYAVGSAGFGGESSNPPANGTNGSSSHISIGGIMIRAAHGAGGFGGYAGGSSGNGAFRGGSGGNNGAGGAADTYYAHATKGVGNPTDLPADFLPLFLRQLWINAPQTQSTAAQSVGGMGGEGYGAGGGGGAGTSSGGGQGAFGWLNPLDLATIPKAEDGFPASGSRNGGMGTHGLVALLFIG